MEQINQNKTIDTKNDASSLSCFQTDNNFPEFKSLKYSKFVQICICKFMKKYSKKYSKKYNKNIIRRKV